MLRTPPHIEEVVIKLITLGYGYSAIWRETGIPIPTLKKIKKRNQSRIDAINAELKEWDAKQAKVVLQRTYELLNLYLDRYDNELEAVSISDLVDLTHHMFIQVELQHLSAEQLSKQRHRSVTFSERLAKSYAHTSFY